ncbi:MAG: SseB family protein [Caulobacter sp.]|nr:SseB family protein [Caulobacter sp.]
MRHPFIAALVLTGCLATSGCSISPGKPSASSAATIENCLRQIGNDHRLAGATERAIIAGDIYVRTLPSPSTNPNEIQIFVIKFKDGREALAAFTSEQRLTSALKDNLASPIGGFADRKFPGTAIKQWNTHDRVVLNYGSEATMEWEVGTFGDAMADTDRPLTCPQT